MTMVSTKAYILLFKSKKKDASLYVQRLLENMEPVHSMELCIDWLRMANMSTTMSVQRPSRW